MKRRGSYIAATIGNAIVLLVGLGASQQQERPINSIGSGHACDEPADVDLWFDWYCSPEREASHCYRVPEDYQDACQAGCVMGICSPSQVPGTELDPMYHTPCEDMHGARFWDELRLWEARCYRNERSAQGLWLPVYDEKWYACVEAAMEQHCPALVGDEWSSMIGLDYGVYELRPRKGPSSDSQDTGSR